MYENTKRETQMREIGQRLKADIVKGCSLMGGLLVVGCLSGVKETITLNDILWFSMLGVVSGVFFTIVSLLSGD